MFISRKKCSVLAVCDIVFSNIFSKADDLTSLGILMIINNNFHELKIKFTDKK